MNNRLDLSRLFRLIGIEIQLNPRTLLIFGVAGLAFLWVVARIGVMDDSPEEDFHQIFFTLILLIAGFLFTSLSFSKLANDPNRQFYLSLPASNLEKFLSKWVVSAILFPLVILVTYWIYAILIDAVVFARFGVEVDPFALFGKNTWFILRLYFVIQGVFLLGSIAFTKLAAVKTITATVLFFGSLGGIAYLLVLIFFGTDLQHNPPIEVSDGLKEFLEYKLVKVANVLFFIVLPLLTWTVAFFKLQEKEL